jgi:hypothetical protein
MEEINNRGIKRKMWKLKNVGSNTKNREEMTEGNNK